MAERRASARAGPKWSGPTSHSVRNPERATGLRPLFAHSGQLHHLICQEALLNAASFTNNVFNLLPLRKYWERLSVETEDVERGPRDLKTGMPGYFRVQPSRRAKGQVRSNI